MDMISNEKKVSKIIIILNAIFIVCIVGIIFYYNYVLKKSYSEFNSENKKLLEIYLNREQMSMKAELDDIINFIKYQQETSYDVMKGFISKKTTDIVELSKTILERESMNIQKFETKDKIIAILKSMGGDSKNENFFVYEIVDENSVITKFRPLMPEKEGLNSIDEVDSEGKKYVKIMLNKITEEDSGFVEYSLLNAQGEDMYKNDRISYVAYFKPFNWIIGYEKNKSAIDEHIKEYAIQVLKMRNHTSNKKRVSIFQIDDFQKLKLLMAPLSGEEIAYIQKQYEDKLDKELKNRGIVFKKYNSKADTESIAYFSEVPEWKWLISAGVNVDNIKKEVNDKKIEIEEQFEAKLKHSIFFGIAIILIVSIISYILILLVKRIISMHKDEMDDKNRQIETRDKEIETSEIRLERVDEIYKKQISENEKILEDALKKKRLIFSNTKIAFLFLDKNLKITDVNSCFCKLFKYTDAELINQDIKILYDNEKYLVDLINEIETKLSRGSILDLEQKLIGKNGKEIRCRISGSSINEHENEQIVLAILDVSFLKKVQNGVDNMETNDEDKTKNDFISNISQEIKTPLNAIKGFAELLENDNLTPTQKKYLESIKMSGDNLRLVVNDIIDISMLENKNVELNNSLIDLETFFRKIRDIFMYKIKQQNLQFTIDINNNVPKFITTDQKKLRQIVINLINNAITNTADGFIKIEVNSKIDKLYISVIDTGKGISMTNLQRLNEAFEAENITKTSEDLGVGLSIVKKLNNLLGCNVKFESKINKGTKATLICPIDLKNLNKGETIEKTQITIETENENTKKVKSSISYDNLEVIWKLEEIKNSDIYKNNLDIVNFKECKFILKKIYQIGKEYKSKEILQYSKKVHEAIEAYDLEAIQKILKDFSQLIESL